MTPTSLLPLALLVLSMCGSPTPTDRPATGDPPTRADPPPAPTRFRLTLGGGPGLGGLIGRQIVESRGDTLVHLGLPDPLPTGPRPETRVVPTEAAWRAFRATLDSLDAFDWQPRYENADVYDGTQWSLEIDDPDRGVRTSGSNAYPGRTRGTHYTDEFEALLRAVNRLAERAVFSLPDLGP